MYHMLRIFCKQWSLNSQHSGVNAGKKKMWKNLKQIMTLERGLPWKQDDPTCKMMKKLTCKQLVIELSRCLNFYVHGYLRVLTAREECNQQCQF